MNLRIMPNYFMVRVEKEKQEAFKYKVSADSVFYMPIGSIHNSRNMEHGEIVQIGKSVAATYGWESCSVGDTLVFHHMIETNQDKSGKRYFLYDDEKYSYYAVPDEYVRAYVKSGSVFPHPSFLFIKNVPAIDGAGELDELTGQKIIKAKGGIVLFEDWGNSPQNAKQKSEQIQVRINSLLKSTRTPEIQTELEALEAEKIKLNRDAKKNRYIPLRVAYSNKKFDRDCGKKIKEDTIVYALNTAALYISNYQDREYKYIIVNTEFVGGVAN